MIKAVEINYATDVLAEVVRELTKKPYCKLYLYFDGTAVIKENLIASLEHMLKA